MGRNTAAKTKLAKVVAVAPQNLEAEIRARAYEFYELRGREHGYDLDDWFRAEESIRRKNIRKTAALSL